MPDQSAEATLKYILDCGISAIELMGDHAESFAGKPENPVNRRAYYSLLRSKRRGEVLNEEQQKELAEMQAKTAVYNKEVAQWRSVVSMDKFEELRKMYNDAGVTIYAFKPRAFGKDNTDDEIRTKIKKAWCEEANIKNNPLLDISKNVILHEFDEMKVERPEKFGGDVNYTDYNQLESDFAAKKLHPTDLKQTVGNYLVKVVSPIRDNLNLSDELCETIKKSF